MDQDLFDVLARCSMPALNSLMVKSGLTSGHMRGVAPVGSAKRFMGRAVTLRAVPAREDLRRRVASGELPDLQMQAFQRLAAGEVLVIDGLSDRRAAVFGDVMATYAEVRGAAAIVIDGAVSDQEAIATLGIPVFALGNAASSASVFLHFVEMDVPVACDGVAVLPGDVLVGDGNGVVVLPREHARAIADAAAEREELEVFVLERIRAGAPLIGTYPPSEETRAAFRAWKAARG